MRSGTVANNEMPDEALTQIEEVQAAIHDGIEKAKALVHEYELRVGPTPVEPGIPNPAT